MTDPGTLPDLVAVRVPAKVNLFLAVRGRRDDGYHEIVTVMQTVDVHDTVTVRLEGRRAAHHHPSGRRLMDIYLVHDGGGSVPDDERNLVVRAAQALAAHVHGDEGSAELRPVSDASDRPITGLEVAKRIPVAAGMAGGSADAAAALLALDRLWGTELDDDELREIAGDLGADVPFSLTGGTALATGIGTATARVLSRGTFHWVAAVPDAELTTGDVYRTWGEVSDPSEVEPDLVFQALRTGDAEALGAAVHNDLEPAACRLVPEIDRVRAALREAGALGVVLSGSGPTVLGLAADRGDAERIARRVAGVAPRIDVVSSPAGGPEVVEER